ncbi:MAG: MFS transporter [Chloroflexota bacterium]
MPSSKSLSALSRDGRLLFATRIVRMFAYGFLSVVLVVYLAQVGLSDIEIGFLLTMTLFGDTAISLLITTTADRVGRRQMLIVGALLMVFGGILFAVTRNPVLLFLGATIGVVSPSGLEIGPFLAIEQAALSETVRGSQRTGVFAWYNLVGSFATAFGALAAGLLVQALQGTGMAPVDSNRVVVLGYAVLGFLLAFFFSRLTRGVEAGRGESVVANPPAAFLGLHRSRDVVFRLAGLFALDAFGGGFVVQSIIAYWFFLRFGVEPALLGVIFFGTNFLAGISALAAASIAARIGLIRTMVFTHLPSNVLLMLVPFMPTLPLAILLLLLRFSISQMDVPTRQSYTMAVVAPDERSAAAGVTGSARTVGAALAPMFVGPMLSSPLLFGAPFVISGALKIAYDLLLFRSFRGVRPPEEAETP